MVLNTKRATQDLTGVSREIRRGGPRERNEAGKATSGTAVANAPRDSAEAASSLARRRKPLWRQRVDSW
jgi:hypothetical protein